MFPIPDPAVSKVRVKETLCRVGRMAGHTVVHEDSCRRSSELLLTKLLSHMPLDHHGRALADLIPILVKEEVPCLREYLDSRWKTTRQLDKMSRQDLMKLKVNDGYDEEDGNAVSAVDLWPDERLVK